MKPLCPALGLAVLWLLLGLPSASGADPAQPAVEPALTKPVATEAEQPEKAAAEQPPAGEKPAADDAPSKSAAEEKPAKQSSAAALLPWTKGLAAGRKQAEADGKPALVRFGASWCGWCVKLDAELEKSAVQDELRRWTLVEVDVDVAPDEARELGVGPIPALRLLAADGHVAVEHDGFLAADELVVWLKSGFAEMQPGASDVLVAGGQPAADELARLIAALADRSVARREAALRRLMSHPASSAAAVAETLATDKLAARLSALELLRAWQAPVDGLDPWRPETLSADRLTAVRDWAATAKETAHAGSAELSPEELAEARDQLDRLLAASEDQAAAIAERLVRHGAALLPLVASRMRDESSDRAQERLLALRYRLVASSALVLEWPGGLKRLASTDVKVRRQAAEELVHHSREDAKPLLLELFADADPLVREISLRGLQQVEHGDSGGALVKLLDDPDPNVRAAVLKQLAENPNPGLFARVVEYAGREQDPDLVGHAVRYLKESNSPKTAEALIELLKHPSWQVRAEVAEALSGLASHNGDASRSADIYAALIELLQDEDAFVVSRAIRGLQNANLAAAVKPLVKAAEAHPELAAEVVKSLENGEVRAQASAELRKFAEHKDPHVRASAIASLIESNPLDEELALQGLGDEQAEVRIASAESLFKVCQQLYGNSHSGNSGLSRRPTRSSNWGAATLKAIFGGKNTEPAAEEEKADEENPSDAWLKEFRQGKARPKWLAATAVLLEKMIAGDDAAERQAAAMALVAIQGEAKALPVMRALVSAPGARREAIAPALPFLLWQPRLALFGEIVQLGVNDQQLAQLVRGMCSGNDPRVAALLWDVLKGHDSVPVADAVYDGLNGLLRGENAFVYLGDQQQVPERTEIPELTPESLAHYGREGSPWQRTIAIALLVNDAEKVEELATPILGDAGAGEEFRADALQLLLMALPQAKAEKLAVEQLNSENAGLVHLALSYLIHGQDSNSALRQTIYISSNHRFSSYAASGEAIEVEPPRGLTADQVRPLLNNKNGDVVAGAAYLLATLGDAAGMEALVKQWRGGERSGHSWVRPLYRAIAALDDDARTPILREINRHLQNYEKREFYWTIRSMKGPDVLKLRKEIRDEVGMENLR